MDLDGSLDGSHNLDIDRCEENKECHRGRLFCFSLLLHLRYPRQQPNVVGTHPYSMVTLEGNTVIAYYNAQAIHDDGAGL